MISKIFPNLNNSMTLHTGSPGTCRKLQPHWAAEGKDMKGHQVPESEPREGEEQHSEGQGLCGSPESPGFDDTRV